jgi:hypothetical protein
MGQITQTTTQLQTILDNADASNAGNTSISDASDTSATSLKKSGFYSLQSSSSNAPSTDRAVVISAVRDTAATGEIRYGQVVITESNGLWWNSDDGGSLGTWYESVGTTATQTLTNKTLTSPVLTTPQINDSAADHQYVFAVANLVADRTVTLPLLTGADTFVFEAHAQTLTNKILTAPVLSGSASAAGSILFKEDTDNGTNAVTLIGPAATADVTVTLPAATDTLVGKATTDTLTNKTITSVVLNTGVSGSAVLDSDTMSGASATTLSSSESIKAYVDAQVATVDTLAEVLAIGNTTGGTNIIVTALDAITTDTISETTAAAGVTIDSVLLKDNTVLAGTMLVAAGSITDSSGAISFGDENLATTGTLGSGALTATTITGSTSLALATGSTVTGIADEDNMASDSATKLATQQSIKAYVDAQVATVDTLAEVLAIGNTTGATDIEVTAAQKVQFRDAAIYINSSVDGQLDIVADTEIQIAATTVDLNGNLDVSGTLGVTGVATLASLVATTADINAGTIDNTVIGGTTAAAGSFTTGAFSSTLGVTGVSTLAAMTATTGAFSGEIAANGGIALGDSDKATFGAGDDLQIYHDGLNSYIDDTGTGDLFIRAENNLFLKRMYVDETYLQGAVNGAVTLYYNGSTKLATTNTGIDVTGTVTADGLITNTAGTSNFIAGVNAGNSIIAGGNYNVVVGDEAGTAITTGDDNVAVGYNALITEDTGSRSVAIGSSALKLQNVNGNIFNTAVGYNAGTAVTNGYQNTFIGGLAGTATTTASNNTAIGYASLGANTTGAGNTALGVATLSLGTTGDDNTAIGNNAMSNGVVTGDDNTALGRSAGYNVTSGANNTFLGHDAGYTGSPGGNITTASNEICLGDENVSSANIQVDWTIASDQRDKTDFTALDLGLDFVKALAPVTYKWDKRSKYGDKTAEGYDLNAQTPDGTHKEDWLDIGFKAQEVEALEIAAGYNKDNKTNLVSSHTDDGKQMGLQYSKFVPILVKAIQEQQTLIESLTARLEAVEGK